MVEKPGAGSALVTFFTSIGDLAAELVFPGNTRVLLNNRNGGVTDNIIKQYAGPEPFQ
jgi:hypothetical protein